MIEDASSGASPSRTLPAVYSDLDAALRALSEFRYERRAIASFSRIPGGRFVHQIVDRAVSRQMDAQRDLAQLHADAVNRAITVLTEIVVQQLDDLQDGLAELRRTVNDLQAARDVP